MSEPPASYETRFSESDNAFLEMMNERLAELELALENQDWLRLSGENDREFSREGLKRICALARLAYLKNPLINRAVSVGTHYVWAQGVTIGAGDKAVNGVVQAFLDDDGNKAELFGRQARSLKEADLQVYGNVFLVLFADPNTGRVRVRSIPVDEIDEIITAPDDRREVRYYRRVYTQRGRDTTTGQPQNGQKTVYYRDWRYQPAGGVQQIGGNPVEQNAVVYHIRVGGLSDMLWGVPEVYSALDWASAYKSFLEDWATIVRAYSRFAWRITTEGGARGVAAGKAKLNTTFGTGGSGTETNPPPGTGSAFIAPAGTKLDPVRTAGATTSAGDGRWLRLMVAAGVGLPETFFGDADVGNHATAKTLDRPTEMRIAERQGLWSDVIVDLCQYAIDWAAVAPMGALAKSGITPRYVQPKTVTGKPPLTSAVDRTVTAQFPDILEQSVTERVEAAVKAATLGGQPPAGTLDLVQVTRLALVALGVEDIDATMTRLFPEGIEDLVWQREELAPVPVPVPVGLQQPPQPTAEALMLEALRELRVMSERGGA